MVWRIFREIHPKLLGVLKHPIFNAEIFPKLFSKPFRAEVVITSCLKRRNICFSDLP
jgi:hypothetical protein